VRRYRLVLPEEKGESCGSSARECGESEGRRWLLRRWTFGGRKL
jgi:hypothetical protein